MINFHSITLADNIYSVGATDWSQRDFHGYETPKGVTYNAYLIKDEKIAVLDTVKFTFAAEYIERLKSLVDLSKIDYVIINHVEPDHSSALPQLMRLAPQAKVVCTEQGKSEIRKYYGEEYDFMVVKEGDSISLGQRTLKFIPLPMLHWPDSMATYLVEDEILFSNDAFGQHICTTSKFDDENNLYEILEEAAGYYANILMPLSRIAKNVLPKVEGLTLKMIAPSHGVIWRSHIDQILKKYEEWSNLESQNKVVIVYDTMWGATEKMAYKIMEGLMSGGVQAKMLRANSTPSSEIAKEILEARGVIVGSPTQHNGVLVTIGGLLYYFRGLQPKGKFAAAFGAFGWAGGSNGMIEEALKAAGMNVQPGITVKWAANEQELGSCFTFGKQFAEMVLDPSLAVDPK